MHNKSILSILGFASIALAGIIASFCTLNGICGLHGISFSWSHCFWPLMGSFLGLTGTFSVFGSLAGARICGSLLGVMRHTYFSLPTCAASIVWATDHRFVRTLIPAACMLLFLVHPVGQQAAAYSFYWFIPIAIGLIKPRNLFCTALASTFTAHAVGSVMHLYMINSMSPVIWLNLIPVVAKERFLFAVGMYVSYHAVRWAVRESLAVLRQSQMDTQSAFF